MLPFDPSEVALRGDEVYHRDVLPCVSVADQGCIVAIDVESGAYAIHADQLVAGDLVLAHNPAAVLWFRRIGADYLHRLGGRFLPSLPRSA